MLELLINERQNIIDMCNNIMKANEAKIYDGSYEAVKAAVKLSKKQKEQN